MLIYGTAKVRYWLRLVILAVYLALIDGRCFSISGTDSFTVVSSMAVVSLSLVGGCSLIIWMTVCATVAITYLIFLGQ